jgi:hypothetical protein
MAKVADPCQIAGTLPKIRQGPSEEVAMTRFAAAAALLLTAAPAWAQATSNDFTPAERARAERAVRAAGYATPKVVTAQAGTLFVTGTKGGTLHYLTVTSNGQVLAPVVVPPPTPAAPAR